MRKWRAAQCLAMPSIANIINDPDMDLQSIEDEPLFMPSSFNNAQREEFDLHTFVDIELQLRKGDAADSIFRLQKALRRIAELETDRRRHTGSVSKHTRARSELDKVHGVKRRLVTEYKCARNAMIRLGMDESCPEFPVLGDTDTYRPGNIEPHEFNSGDANIGWIWLFGNETYVDQDASEWDRDGK